MGVRRFGDWSRGEVVGGQADEGLVADPGPEVALPRVRGARGVRGNRRVRQSYRPAVGVVLVPFQEVRVEVELAREGRGQGFKGDTGVVVAEMDNVKLCSGSL